MKGSIWKELIAEVLGSLRNIEIVADPPDDEDLHRRINPATGLKMVGVNKSLDVGGNPYGTDLMNSHSTPADR